MPTYFRTDICSQFPLRVLALILSLLLCMAEASALLDAREVAVRVGLQELIVSAEAGNQAQARVAWKKVVDNARAEELPRILRAMNAPDSLRTEGGPTSIGALTENWLRSAVDAVAERELRDTKNLPSNVLEEFVSDAGQSPKARRVAYEWLTKVDETAPGRLLPGMLDDESLELRYDAIAGLLGEAKDASSDDAKREKYQRALKSARDKVQLKECAEALAELGETPNMAKQLGFLTRWKVVGPFDNTDRKGFNKIHLDVNTIDFDAEYEGKHGPVKWKEAVAEQESLEKLGVVDLNEELVEEKSVLAYAATTFVSAKDQEVECRYETKEATKLWVNGEEVAVNNVYHSGGGFDQYIVPCKLSKGQNKIVIKVCQNEQTQPWTKPWDFRLRVTDHLGGAIQQAK